MFWEMSIDPSTKAQFLALPEAYEYSRKRLIAHDMQGAVIAVTVWKMALEAVALTNYELRH